MRDMSTRTVWRRSAYYQLGNGSDPDRVQSVQLDGRTGMKQEQTQLQRDIDFKKEVGLASALW